MINFFLTPNLTIYYPTTYAKKSIQVRFMGVCALLMLIFIIFIKDFLILFEYSQFINDLVGSEFIYINKRNKKFVFKITLTIIDIETLYAYFQEVLLLPCLENILQAYPTPAVDKLVRFIFKTSQQLFLHLIINNYHMIVNNIFLYDQLIGVGWFNFNSLIVQYNDYNFCNYTSRKYDYRSIVHYMSGINYFNYINNFNNFNNFNFSGIDKTWNYISILFMASFMNYINYIIFVNKINEELTDNFNYDLNEFFYSLSFFILFFFELIFVVYLVHHIFSSLLHVREIKVLSFSTKVNLNNYEFSNFDTFKTSIYFKYKNKLKFIIKRSIIKLFYTIIYLINKL